METIIIWNCNKWIPSWAWSSVKPSRKHIGLNVRTTLKAGWLLRNNQWITVASWFQVFVALLLHCKQNWCN
jgi:hypothetical protein